VNQEPPKKSEPRKEIKVKIAPNIQTVEATKKVSFQKLERMQSTDISVQGSTVTTKRSI
jgi:hypothetical protein